MIPVNTLHPINPGDDPNVWVFHNLLDGQGVCGFAFARNGDEVQTACLMEVKAGTAYAAVLDLTLANAMVGKDGDYVNLKIVDRLGVEDYGVAFRKGSDITEEVNKAFLTLKEQGFLQELAQKYGLDLAI